MKITVHHIREENVVADLHLYCGRPRVLPTKFVDAQLGNPFPLTSESMRTKVCDDYAKSLDQPEQPHHKKHWTRIKRIAERLTEGKSIALYCFCAPKACHCDEIRRRALILTQS